MAVCFAIRSPCEKLRALLKVCGQACPDQGRRAATLPGEWVAGTSMEAIADEAGVSKQILYRHFETRVNLLGAVVTSELADLSLRARLPASVEDPTQSQFH
ncbi:MAG: helix-turn-helix transcriptional regulator [Propionibacteriaceae bacterium]|nr:helix-turn-helix transcriptional regulator [Propionibacteriaceae bacterium]